MVKIVWNAETRKDMYYCPFAYYNFNFYGEFSETEYSKSNINNQELKNKIKLCVNDSLSYLQSGKSVYNNIYYKKYIILVGIWKSPYTPIINY